MKTIEIYHFLRYVIYASKKERKPMAKRVRFSRSTGVVIYDPSKPPLVMFGPNETKKTARYRGSIELTSLTSHRKDSRTSDVLVARCPGGKYILRE
jgi:hypothetical protein